MNPQRAALPAPTSDSRPTDLRLDGVHYPYGPSPLALEAAGSADRIEYSRLVASLRCRISETYRVPREAIVLVNGVDGPLRNLLRAADGPIVAFPPSASAAVVAEVRERGETIKIARGAGRHAALASELVGDLPGSSVAFIESPSDPLGAVLPAADLVRLARACQIVVVDERFTEFAGTSLVPLAFELDNVVVLRSFEYWAGVIEPPCAWVVSSTGAADRLGLTDADLQPASAAAAIATLEDLASVEATLRLVREERSRLFRFARKLSFMEPLPSRGPFLAARIQMVSRDLVVSRLAARGVHVHAPRDAGLEPFIRIGIGSRRTMERFSAALLELAPELVGQPVSAGSAQR